MGTSHSQSALGEKLEKCHKHPVLVERDIPVPSNCTMLCQSRTSRVELQQDQVDPIL